MGWRIRSLWIRNFFIGPSYKMSLAVPVALDLLKTAVRRYQTDNPCGVKTDAESAFKGLVAIISNLGTGTGKVSNLIRTAKRSFAEECASFEARLKENLGAMLDNATYQASCREKDTKAVFMFIMDYITGIKGHPHPEAFASSVKEAWRIDAASTGGRRTARSTRRRRTSRGRGRQTRRR